MPDEPLPTYSVPLPSGHSTADPLFSVHEVESPFLSLPSPSTASSTSSPSTPSYPTQDSSSPLPSLAEIDGLDLPDGWIKQWDSQNECEFFVDTRANPPRSSWVHPYEDLEFIQSIPDSQQPSTSASSSTQSAAASRAAAEIRARREDQDRRTQSMMCVHTSRLHLPLHISVTACSSSRQARAQPFCHLRPELEPASSPSSPLLRFISADSARRNYDFANGYNGENSVRFNRPPVRYPSASSSFSGRPSPSQLTAAEIRQRREAQDSRSRPTSTQPNWPLAYRDNLQAPQPVFKPVQYSRSYSAAPSRPSSSSNSTPTLSAVEVRARREAHDSRGRATPSQQSFARPPPPPIRNVNPNVMSTTPFTRYNSLPTTHAHSPVTGSSGIRRAPTFANRPPVRSENLAFNIEMRNAQSAGGYGGNMGTPGTPGGM